MQKITNDEKLKLYGLYKQAENGDNTAAAPWAVQMEAKAKWTAWEAEKGKAKLQAAEEYTAYVESLLKKYGADEKYLKF